MNYYSIEGRLYTLSNSKVEKLKILFPEEKRDDDWDDFLEWIETNGRYIDVCQNYAY